METKEEQLKRLQKQEEKSTAEFHAAFFTVYPNGWPSIEELKKQPSKMTVRQYKDRLNNCEWRKELHKNAPLECKIL